MRTIKINKKKFEEVFSSTADRLCKTGAKRKYIEFHKERFFFIIKEIDNFFGFKDNVEILEIGPEDYFLSCLLREFFPKEINIDCIEHPDALKSSITEKNLAEDFKTIYLDLERESVTINKKYDLILCCEVIEHLIFSPTFFLFNLHGLLKPDGLLLITTDNVSRITNIVKLLLGQNIFYFLQPFSCFRHNREYTRRELEDLLEGVGYKIIRGGYFNFTPFIGKRLFFLMTKGLFSLTYLPLMKIYSRHIFLWCRKEKGPDLYFPGWLHEFPSEIKKLILAKKVIE